MTSRISGQPTVFIVCPNPEYVAMFKSFGWNVTETIEDADLVQFTGGADVSPDFYGQSNHPKTHSNRQRDVREAIIFNMALDKKIPMAGICRGGQFLNVMCGGSMWQHVDGHSIGAGHYATDERSGDTFLVSSTHHQMMIPDNHGEIIVTASCSHTKERCGSEISNGLYRLRSNRDEDIEAVYYPLFDCFCFQPHPEFNGWDQLADIYLRYLQEFFNL